MRPSGAGSRDVSVSERGGVLELAVLGLLHEGPMHGYELRKRLSLALGAFRAFSYGSLYPCLRQLVAQGHISPEGDADLPPLPGRRSKIVYRITSGGEQRFQELVGDARAANDDEGFGVSFAFFSRTDSDVRLRILEARRLRLEERMGRLRSTLQRTREKLDTYTLELQKHGLESVEREVRWLNELIATERGDGAAKPRLPLQPAQSQPASPGPQSAPRNRPATRP